MRNEDITNKMSIMQHSDLSKLMGERNKSKMSTTEMMFTVRGGQFTKHSPPTPSRCGTLLSPYDVAVTRNFDAKLMSNKVHNPWYRRYSHVLPEENDLQFQPYEEIQNRDENIAVQHYLGSAYRYFDNTQDKWAKVEKDSIVRRYNKMKQAEEDRKFVKPASGDNVSRAQSLRSIIAAKKAKEMSMKEMFGPTGHEKLMITPICLQFLKLKMRRKRRLRFVPEFSKWHILHNPLVRKKSKHFLEVKLLLLAGDTHCIFKDIKAFHAERNRLLEKCNQPDALGRKKFNPALYTFKKEVHLSMELKLSMMSSWQQRSSEIIDKVLEALQQIRTFVEYPIAYQKLLAKAAWFVVVPAFRVVIRQKQPAVSYYIMINGRAKVEQLVGSPHHSEPSEFKVIKTLKAQDSFGEECITRPGSLREWTITTETICEMLSVNCHEFQEMVLTAAKFEDAPEHIRFLGSLHFLRNFPKLKLLEEALSNINVAHFLNDSVVTLNAEKSEYVYVVYYGTCKVLKEIPPPRLYRLKSSNSSESTSSSWRSAQSTSSASSWRRALDKKRRQESSLERHGKPSVSISTYFESQRNYIESKETLRTVLHKELEKRQNEFLNYRASFLAEAREIEEKCRAVSQTLSLASRKYFCGGQKLLPPLSPSSDFIMSARGTSHRHAIDGAMRKKFLLSSDMTDSTTSTFANMDRIHTIKETLDDSSGSDILSLKHPSKVSIVEGDKLNSQDCNDTQSIDSSHDELKIKRKYTKLVGSNINILDAVYFQETDGLFPELKPKKKAHTIVDVAEMAVKKSIKNKRTEWAVVRQVIRGDIMGVEYLDFKTDPFEPPKGTLSMVSDGATIIMMKKEFLLQYLRKDW